MRIAFFSDNYYPELSGVSDVIIVATEELVKRGHEVRIYAPSHPPKNYARARVQEKELRMGDRVSVYRLPSLPYQTGTGQGRLVIPYGRTLHDIKKFSPDVIHTHQFFGVGLEALMSARRLKIPLVGTNHTAIREFMHYGPTWIPGLEDRAMQYMIWFYNKCLFVSTPSEFLLREMKENGLTAPSEAIHNPAKLLMHNIPDADKKMFKKEFSVSNRTVIYVGRLAPEKNIDVLIRAIAIAKKEVPDINLLIAGDGSIMDKLKELSKTLGIEKSVVFAGMLDKPTLARAYGASDVFATASTSENQPISLMEAMAAGMPVVGARSRGLPEYIKPETGCLFEPGNEHEMASCLMELFRDTARAERMGEAGSKVIQDFSLSEITGKWEDVYARILRDNKK